MMSALRFTPTVRSAPGAKHAVQRRFFLDLEQDAVVSGDIGGALAARGGSTSNIAPVLWAARSCGGPSNGRASVRRRCWPTSMAGDSVGEIELGWTATTSLSDCVASDRQHWRVLDRSQFGAEPAMMIGTAAGVYDIPCAYALVTCVLSKHQPDRTYRGRWAARGNLSD